MKFLIKYTTLLILVMASAAFINAQDPIEGFRDMKWGTSFEKADEMMDLSKQETNGKIEIYASPTDSHQLGTVELKEIYYFFHKDAGFFKIVMSGNESENEEMGAILKNRLGLDYDTVMDPSHSHNIWVVDDVTVVYKQQLSKDFIVSIRSEAIANYKKSLNQTITDF
ncbi:hypothetical protein [Portibacter marinus]|uniref:hypothetical protein n=1 Tax=Portibacter marinus TaxID=2898660 RepID=UPI001F1DEA68|nr:hypothetical protein [Portibacter marinus]